MSRPAVVATYMASLAIFALAFAVRSWFDPYLPPGFPFLTFFPAVFVSGFVFGVRQGIMVALLSAFASWYFFIPPVGVKFSAGPLLAMGLYLFVVSTELAMIALMMHAFRAEARALKETRRLADQQETMAQELDHRLKNIFATMNAIISLSLRGVTSPQELAARLRERVSALGRSNLLLRGFRAGEEVSFRSVAEQALEPFSIVGTPRLSAAGPHLPIGGQSLVVMGLVLHELGTNAAKYGALSVQGGQVQLAWQMEQDSDTGADNLFIEWRESGGPRLEPGARGAGGFGSTLMTRVIANVGGHADIDYPPEGALVRIVLPSEMLNQENPAAP